MQQSLRPAHSRTYLLPRPYLARKSARGHSPHAANSGAPAVSRRCSVFEWLAQSLFSVFPLAGKRCICSCMAKNRDEDIPVRDVQEITKKKKVRDKDENIAALKEQRTAKKVKPAESEYAKAEATLAASDIKDKYKESTLPPKWKAFHTVIFLEKDDGLKDASKIAAFDFDGCLAKTSVKRIGPDSWSLMYRSIPDKLQKLYADGFKLVIFTNESNIDRWKNKRQMAVDSKIGRLNNFIKHVSVPIQVFIACGFDKSGVEDPYRKPKAGMWHVMEKHFNSGILVDMDQSFYVGDAAGRPNDHSDADIKFAQAIGLKFYLPEEFFTV